MMCFRDLPGWLSLSSRVMLLQLLEESSQLLMGCSSGDHHVCDPVGVYRRTWSGVCIAACAVGGVVLLSLVYSRQLWDSLASWRESGAATCACHTGWHRLLRRDRQGFGLHGTMSTGEDSLCCFVVMCGCLPSRFGCDSCWLMLNRCTDYPPIPNLTCYSSSTCFAWHVHRSACGHHLALVEQNRAGDTL